MFKTRNLRFLLILSLILCISATGQQPPTQQQISQVNKVRKKLTHYDTGTKLDVQLSNGSHQIGMLSQTGSTAFVLVDPVSSKSETIDYLDVRRVQPTGKEYMTQQLRKTANGLPKISGLALLTVAVVAVLWVVVK